MNQNFGLKPEEWALLKALLIDPLKSQGANLWIFGSRARGSHHTYSDIDILYSLPEKVKGTVVAKISEALENSSLPYRVDLVEESQLAIAYRDGVLAERVEL